MLAAVAQPLGRAPEAALLARASAAALSLASSDAATPSLSMAPLARAARTSSMMLWGVTWGGASNAMLVRNSPKMRLDVWAAVWSLTENKWSWNPKDWSKTETST